MKKWFHIFHRNTGLSPYVWVVLYILPFYFIVKTSSTNEVVIGLMMILVFFACHVLAFISKGRMVYFWTSVQILISIAMTLFMGYVYFALFIAFFIGNIRNLVGFWTLYNIHLITAIAAVNFGFVTQREIIVAQLPFIIVSMIGVVLLPVTTYNRNKREALQGQLEDANKRISELVKLEERQRIARDLHDTLGQKLSLIGLKSDLAGKLISKNPAKAHEELQDIRQTARTALNEVRELVTQMRGTRLVDEMFRVKQILKAAQIEFVLESDPLPPVNTTLMGENVLCMCLKEAVTNLVKHSSATECTVSMEPTPTEFVLRVRDNGVGMSHPSLGAKGHGLQGMKERLEFVNGSMEIVSRVGTMIVFRVPAVVQQPGKEASK
ncbi:sensor histidine kinase [Paenibacillus koleovorans]|uniref:sensor histidine kinase n=1 Tax=Paenibacillus koleovorans TaxID=121608 RepID=UPI000FD91F2B|nr:sensor histidine kinase [Paenibacillus koleovorans]